MNITTALELAQRHIYVSYHGGYYVAKPYNGLTDVTGPTVSPSSTMDYHQAIVHCRADRVAEVVAAVTGDQSYSYECHYNVMNQPRDCATDWRILSRRFVRAYRSKAA